VSKCAKGAENVFAPLMPLGPGKRHLQARQFIKMNQLIPVLTHLSFY